MNRMTIKQLLTTVVLAAVLVFCALAVSEELSFAIVERPPQLAGVKVRSPKVGKVVITWHTIDCSGYDIKYSTDKKMKKNVVVIQGRGGSHKKTIKNLKPGKVYYFRIRAYRNRIKSSIHGKWSKRIKRRVHKHKYVRTAITPLTSGIKKQYQFKCSCGDIYYKAKALSGRSYRGIVYALPSCVPGQIKYSWDGAIKSIAPSKTHIPVQSGKYTVCKRCGQKLNYVEGVCEDEETGKENKVVFTAPKNTFVNTSLAVSVKNSSGAKYNYRLYYQKSKDLYIKYPEYQKYLDMHGCSTCVLTSVLNATVPKYRNYTPDQVIEEVIKPVVGKDTFNANFSKKLEKQMPISLKGISKVLTANGVRNKYVYKYTRKKAIKLIREHLKSGNPIIFYMSKSVLTPNTHAMLMLGLDKNGRVITGDTVHRSAKDWGKNNRLVKFNRKSSASSTTVENICKYFNSSTNSLDKVADFYNGRFGNIAFVLVYKDK